MHRVLILIVFTLLSFITHKGSAQYKISGVVSTASDSSGVADVTVTVNHGQFTAVTDQNGYYEIKNLPNGKYSLSVNDTVYKSVKHHITLKDQDAYVIFQVTPSVQMLDRAHIKRSPEVFMRSVENMGIYEGKKSDVIIPDSMVANLSTNNARQLYSRVAGLNIFENDGAGVQLSIGGRGLDPNRTANFNTRQNGYDISADALGYPESYYTPPVEALDRIQVVRGAASLQYGTQFGGLLNFILRKPVKDKKIELVARQGIGSFGFYNAFASISGTIKKFSYYTAAQYKTTNGWRPNSHLDYVFFYTNLQYQFSVRTSIALDFTHMNYLAKQPGGLSDAMFAKNPRQSNRERNYFKVNWNMMAIHFNHKFDENNLFNLRVFGLSAYRYSIGFRPNRVSTIDDNSERDLIRGNFTNWGAEARYLRYYTLKKKEAVLLTGIRYYYGYNESTQGQGTTGKDANFDYVDDNIMTYDYHFPNQNVSVFAENIFYINDQFSITPGVRFEFIKTTADGQYSTILRDLAGNVINVTSTDEYRINQRYFIIAGIGLSYKPLKKVNLYANISQNYRSITFSDMRISNGSLWIDPDMKDESGYSADLGVRSDKTKTIIYDVSLFYLFYNNRIGEVLDYNSLNQIIRKRGNIGQAIVLGIESYVEADLFKLFLPNTKKWTASAYVNLALIHSRYTKSEEVNVKGKQVEYVPDVNLKTGLRWGYNRLKFSYQFTYLSEQYSDATNTINGGEAAVAGIIPSYMIMDFSLSYEYRNYKLEGSVNNFTNTYYYTRRATGYPGPGILPSDGRGFYLSLQVKI